MKHRARRVEVDPAKMRLLEHERRAIRLENTCIQRLKLVHTERFLIKMSWQIVNLTHTSDHLISI